MFLRGEGEIKKSSGRQLSNIGSRHIRGKRDTELCDHFHHARMGILLPAVGPHALESFPKIVIRRIVADDVIFGHPAAIRVAVVADNTVIASSSSAAVSDGISAVPRC